jgi:hypothetical protein
VEELIKNNLGLQVLTDTGWSEFEGLLIKGSRQVVRLQLTDCFLKTTLDHEIYTDRLEKKSVKQLKVKDKIYTKHGTQSVVSIKLLGTEPVYDLLNVKDNRRFFANDILCSNCEFIINDETLIAPAKLLDLEGQDPIRRSGQVRWYQEPRRDSIYVVALDPSLGTGGDPAAIQVFEAGTTRQIAEWQHNRTTIPEQIRILADVVRELHAVVGDEKQIYYSVENNTIGEAALISIAEFGEENIPGYFLSDSSVVGQRRFRRGFNTTAKAKLTACNKLKILVESGRMQLASRRLISELKTFVAHGVSYAAKPGETDDLVMGTILAVRMMMLLQEYHSELDSQMRDHGDTVIEPMPFISVMR